MTVAWRAQREYSMPSEVIKLFSRTLEIHHLVGEYTVHSTQGEAKEEFKSSLQMNRVFHRRSNPKKSG